MLYYPCKWEKISSEGELSLTDVRYRATINLLSAPADPAGACSANGGNNMEWNLKEALEYCANDKVLNGTVMKIAAEDATPIVVCASSADYEHDGCDGCQYENFDFTSEPCSRCRCCTGEPAHDLYRPKEGK